MRVLRVRFPKATTFLGLVTVGIVTGPDKLR
jgi:hypothetical protein